MIRDYYKRIGVEVVATITGDGRIDDIRRAHGAALNVVQCSGSMVHLAKDMEEKYGIPFLRVSYFGIEDMSKALYDVAEFFGDAEHRPPQPASWCARKWRPIMPELRRYREALDRPPGRGLHGRGLQGLFARPLAADAGHEDRAGRLADRQQGGLRAAPRTVRRGHDPRRRHQPPGTLAVRAGKGGRPVHRRREGAAHRLQAGHRLLRPQPRAQRGPGRFRGHDQFRPRGLSLGEIAGVETGAAKRPAPARRRTGSNPCVAEP